ncbi:MAG TPA: hypothetical protein VE078_03065 [Thermoanaerobaculia bacterium]|nr:hypothetical protein [Thermoanaerobaculia bacterium]
MGTHETLMDRLETLLGGEEVPFAPKLQFESGGTVNFWAMGIAGEYLRALRFGSDPEKTKARNRAREYFDRQRKDGHMSRGFAVEQTCLDPHYNFHLVSAAVIRLGAREAGHADVLEDSGQWFRWHTALYKSCLSARGEVFMPGLRAKGKPSWQVSTMAIREILGLPRIGAARKPAKLKDRFFAGPRVVRQLLAEGDDLGGAKDSDETPFLRLPMTVRQFEGGHVAFLSRPGEELTILEPLDWVSVRYDADDDFEIGRDWEKDPPEQAASLRREQRIGEA